MAHFVEANKLLGAETKAVDHNNLLSNRLPAEAILDHHVVQHNLPTLAPAVGPNYVIIDVGYEHGKGNSAGRALFVENRLIFCWSTYLGNLPSPQYAETRCSKTYNALLLLSFSWIVPR